MYVNHGPYSLTHHAHVISPAQSGANYWARLPCSRTLVLMPDSSLESGGAPAAVERGDQFSQLGGQRHQAQWAGPHHLQLLNYLLHHFQSVTAHQPPLGGQRAGPGARRPEGEVGTVTLPAAGATPGEPQGSAPVCR